MILAENKIIQGNTEMKTLTEFVEKSSPPSCAQWNFTEYHIFLQNNSQENFVFQAILEIYFTALRARRTVNVFCINYGKGYKDFSL